MAVFTSVTGEQLYDWLDRYYEIGALRALQGISAGVENTNYFVTTTAAEFVLTLFERLPREHASFYLDFMAHLSHHQIACPRPIRDRSKHYLGELNGKPATLVTRLPGHSIVAVEASHCERVGALLARMHLAAADFPGVLGNPRGPSWWMQARERVYAVLPESERALLDAELEFQMHHWPTLPQAVVHADLFRDNVLWTEDAITGVIDFYFAGVDALLFDLAVTANDWCSDAAGALDNARLAALLCGYQTVRSLMPEERAAWPLALRRAALRFWLSRLDDVHTPRAGELITPHDPNRFKTILQQRISNPALWPSQL